MVLNPPISNCATADEGEEILACVVALEAEYDIVLIKYQEAYANYTNLLINPPSSDRKILEKENKLWTPTGDGRVLSSSITLSKTECKNGCANNIECSAAVFDSNTPKKCFFYKGDGKITQDKTESHTLYISKEAAAKTIVEKLQTRLEAIIDELKTKSADPSLTTYIDSNNKDYILKKDLIKTKYNLLVDDNIIVNNSLNQYNTKDNEFNQQKGFVNQQHLSYRFWTIFTIIIIIIVLKYILGINSPSGNIMIWTTVRVLASFSLSKPSGFAMMGLILIILLLKTIKDYFTQNL